MLDLIPTIERLSPKQQPWTDVEDLLDLSELEEVNKNRLPRLFVLEIAERARPDIRGSGTPLQSVQLEIAVVILVSKRNGQRNKELKQIRKTIRKKLFGWSPDGEAEPYVLSGGNLLKLNSGYCAWIDRFITEYTEDAADGS